jgi:predicted nucleic acid-binding Zn ribbon protein
VTQDTQTAVEERCVECKSELPAPGARKCAKCGSWQDTTSRCPTCLRTIPKDAEFCNECKLYRKGLLRKINVSQTFLLVLTAMVTVLTFIITQSSTVFHRHSETEFKVTGANDILVHLKVWNNGREPSTLLSYRLKFRGLPLKDIALFPTEAGQGRIVMPPGNPVELVLEPYDKLTTTCNPSYDQPCVREELLKRLAGSSVTLEMQVEESGHFWNLFTTHPFRHTQSDTFSGRIIYQFLEKMP